MTKKVLFVCLGNTCRSPMAEAIFASLAKETSIDIEVNSAGLSCLNGNPPAKNAVLALENLGLSLNHTSSQLTENMIEENDYIFTMEKYLADEIKSSFLQFAGKVYSIGEFSGSNKEINDPYGGDLSTYRNCASNLYDELLLIAKKLK